MQNYNGIDAFALYPKALQSYEEIIKDYSYRTYAMSDIERVYVIEDSFALYIGLVNFGDDQFPNHIVVFEELLYNEIYKFNASKFKRVFTKSEQNSIMYKRFHGIWGEPIRSLENNAFADTFSDEQKAHYLIRSKCYEVSEKIPILNLKDRFDQWEGYLNHYIIFELAGDTRTGYAIYCTQNPQIHKVAYDIANKIEWQALEQFAYLTNYPERKGDQPQFAWYQFEKGYLRDGVNCDQVIIELLCKKIETYKASGWKHKNKKNLSSERLCIAEHELKYFVISRYAKTHGDALEQGWQLFQKAHNGFFKTEPKYEYIIPENKWKSEQRVYEIVKRLYHKYTVLYQYRPFFLHTDKGQMSYDVYICGKDIAIEYQGKQHFEPVEIFGGKEHFIEQVQRDRLKKKLSDDNGVTLVYINYDDDISPDLIQARIESELKNKKKAKNEQH